MYPIGTVWNKVADAWRKHASPDMSRIKASCQDNYYHLCTLMDWQLLRRKVSATLSGTDTTGYLLPGDLCQIIAVIDSDGMQIVPSNQANVGEALVRRHWAYADGAIAPVAAEYGSGKGITIQEGATDFATTTAISAAYVGEYIRLASQPYAYKLTSATALTPAYRGPALVKKPYEVRPGNCRRILIYDEDGNLFGDTVTIHYWVYPEPLYQEDQIVMLPGTRPLELLTIIEILGLIDKAKVEPYRAEYEIALNDMISSNPSFPKPLMPRGIGGATFYFGRKR